MVLLNQVACMGQVPGWQGMQGAHLGEVHVTHAQVGTFHEHGEMHLRIRKLVLLVTEVRSGTS